MHRLLGYALPMMGLAVSLPTACGGSDTQREPVGAGGAGGSAASGAKGGSSAKAGAPSSGGTNGGALGGAPEAAAGALEPGSGGAAEAGAAAGGAVAGGAGGQGGAGDVIDECAPVLTNGAFSNLFHGWTPTGVAETFLTYAGTDYFPNLQLYAMTTGGSKSKPQDDTIVGTLSQDFVVPTDTAVLSFFVWGGSSAVRLYKGNKLLQEAKGPVDNTYMRPVRWELGAYAGETLKLAIEDGETAAWGFISASAFRLMRRDDGYINQGYWQGGFATWDPTGDAANFRVIDDVADGERGYYSRKAISTYTTAGAHLGNTATGTLLQTFAVPADAVALQFDLRGSPNASVRLLDANNTQLHSVSGIDDNVQVAFKNVAVSWDLTALRGSKVKIEIRDDAADANGMGMLVVSGFDLITECNGF